MKKRKGVSLVETLLMVTVLTMILSGAAAMTVNTGKSFRRSTNQLEVDQNAAIGIQWISQDMQEAKAFEIKSSSWIRVFFPVQAANGTYNRKITDTVNYIDFYRGLSNGNRDANGTFLIRAKVGQPNRKIISDIYNLYFESDSPSSVNVDVQVRRTVSGKTYNCTMYHRAILMRNYQQ